jgi:hypothetical protein
MNAISPSPLILISGLPRSGTTWLGKLFDSHPSVLYRHEPDSVFPLKWLPTVLTSTGEEYTARVREFMAGMPRMRDAKISASRPMFAKSYFGATRQFMIKQAMRAAKLAAAAGWQMPVAAFCAPPANAEYVLAWKSIESCGRLACFTRALQPLRVIQILRHPGGVVASQIRGKRLNKFNGYDPAADYDYFKLWLAPEDDEALAHLKTLSEAERLTWLNLVRLEKAVGDIAGREDCRVVVYEDLCARPEEILEELFAFCGLDFCAQTQRFLRESTSKTDKSYFGLFKNSSESAHKWKTELEEPSRAAVLRMLARSPLARYWQEESF